MQDTLTYVDKTAKCKRCGSKTVVWQTSRKTGRYYLTEVFKYDDGDKTDHRDFHSAYCELPARHAEKQDAIFAAMHAKAADEKAAKAAKDSELRRAENTASDAVLRWYQMTTDEITDRLPLVEAELAEDERKLAVETNPANRYTMDDFHEQNKQLARIHAHKVRISSSRQSATCSRLAWRTRNEKNSSDRISVNAHLVWASRLEHHDRALSARHLPALHEDTQLQTGARAPRERGSMTTNERHDKIAKQLDRLVEREILRGWQCQGDTPGLRWFVEGFTFDTRANHGGSGEFHPGCECSMGGCNDRSVPG